jgi:tetratricopeptide (TPR) repeat protein
MSHLDNGLRLQKDRKFHEAYRQFVAAIREDCHCAGAYFIIGCILRSEKKYALAVTCLRKAVALNPDSVDYQYELGEALRSDKQFRQAEGHFRQALTLDNTKAKIWYSLAVILSATGRTEEAKIAIDNAVRLEPWVLASPFFQSVVLLASGDYELGFRLYETRRKINPYRSHPCPEWQGEDLTTKTLFIECEQGFGDILQVARFFNSIRAEQVFLGAPKELHRLLRSSFPNMKIVAKNDDYLADFYVLSGSLPWKIGLTNNLASIPGTPYLTTHRKIPLMRPKNTSKAVGICWYGSTDHENNAARSSDVETFYRNLTGLGIELYSLQVNVPDPNLALLGEIGLIHDMAPMITDFADTAAIMKELDCIVTVDTAIAHLAGALGVECHVIIPYHQVDWRWLHDRNDTPWYPSMTLHRQGEFETWDQVLQKIRDTQLIRRV